jgi:hypothetical protein
MPAEQRGQVYATAKGYGIRWYDEKGAPPPTGGLLISLGSPSLVP